LDESADGGPASPDHRLDPLLVDAATDRHRRRLGIAVTDCDVHVPRFAAYERFVNFDFTTELAESTLSFHVEIQRSRVAGSPSRTQVHRTSPFETAAFARIIASPIVNPCPLNSCRYAS
jgi:hypothetical protein